VSTFVWAVLTSRFRLLAALCPLPSSSISRPVESHSRWCFPTQTSEQLSEPSRRHFVRKIALGVLGSTLETLARQVESSSAADTGETVLPTRRPYAPLENLLPATRVRVWINHAVDLTSEIATIKDDDSTNIKRKQELISQLQNMLLGPREFMSGKAEASASQRYLQQETLTEWTRARQKDTRNLFAIESVDPLTRLNEGFEQWGERRQFRRLRRQQQELERADPIRAAFNAYTNNLVFGESYLLTASKEEKSRLIRQYGQLPDVTSVIKSDLDLRDLYRNQILTAVDNAKAELQYQLKTASSSTDGRVSSSTAFDATELLALLKEAQSECDKWFDFISESDKKEAMDAVKSEV